MNEDLCVGAKESVFIQDYNTVVFRFSPPLSGRRRFLPFHIAKVNNKKKRRRMSKGT